jgi:predicted O-methyltransferase YrrM
MRGPLLSGPLGSSTVLDALLVRLRGAGKTAVKTAVIGPLWLAETLSAEIPVVLLIEPEESGRARRIARRAATDGHRLTVVIAGVELPLQPGAADALVIEGAAALDAEALARWTAALVPALRPGGLLIAADVTDDPAVEARLAGQFLGAALTGIAQDRPRDGVVLTIGTAPEAALVKARFEAAS